MSAISDDLGSHPDPLRRPMNAAGFETDMPSLRDDGEGGQPASGTPLMPGRPRPPVRPELLPVWPVELVWRCDGCGYVRQSTNRPEFCPACGAGPNRLVGRSSIEWRRIFRQEMPTDDRRGGR
jgi:hypothetical protein